MDQLKSLNNEHYQVVFNWHQSIQQVTYGLNVAGTDHEHLISTSMHVRDIILTNYITS